MGGIDACGLKKGIRAIRLLQTGIRLALPYNHDPKYASWLDDHSVGVVEVYLPLHPSVAASARIWTGPFERSLYLERLRELATVLKAHEIEANLVVNAVVFGRQRGPVVAELLCMAEIFANVSVTTGDYHLAEQIRREAPALRLGASVFAEVDSVRRARYWRRELGAESVVLSRRINKRLGAIRAIRSEALRIKMVLDDSCVPDCPAQSSHLMLLTEGAESPTQECIMEAVHRERPWCIAQHDVVPGHLANYDGLVDVGKVAGRERSLSEIEEKRLLYLEAKSLRHTSKWYFEPPEAFERICSCDRDCEACGWCESAFNATEG